VVVVYLDSDLVSERFAEGSYLRGGWCCLGEEAGFVGVISSRGSLCYSGPCSSSLALVCVFGVV